MNIKGTGGVLACGCASERASDLLSMWWLVLDLILGSMCVRKILLVGGPAFGIWLNRIEG
jgi:hypothetical protein